MFHDFSLFLSLSFSFSLFLSLSLQGRIRHHGPVLLAWAAFHCRVEQIVSSRPVLLDRLSGTSYAQDYLSSVPFKNYAATAFGIDVIRFLTACSSHLSDGSEHNLVGYLSILKQLLSATLTAFDINVVPNKEHFVLFACKLFSHQPALCTQVNSLLLFRLILSFLTLCHQFWAWDANHSARGSLLRWAQSEFPFDFFSWLTLLKALACDSEGAVHALNAVQSLRTFTQVLPMPPVCGLSECQKDAVYQITLNDQVRTKHPQNKEEISLCSLLIFWL